MLSYNGWFEIIGHWLEEKECAYDEHRIAERVRAEAERLSRYDNISVDVVGLNGTYHLSPRSAKVE